MTAPTIRPLSDDDFRTLKDHVTQYHDQFAGYMRALITRCDAAESNANRIAGLAASYVEKFGDECARAAIAESALATERERTAKLEAALARLVNGKALSGVRDLVAGWNGESHPVPFKHRHPNKLGATLKTNCGAIYELDDAMQAARAALSPADGGNDDV
ncbi:MAG: hypothetical protein P4L76_13365 [Beijerinckiaceae bacterium]|nr:hypothetical protein [Beijerinckiaceae bacterium]